MKCACPISCLFVGVCVYVCVCVCVCVCVVCVLGLDTVVGELMYAA